MLVAEICNLNHLYYNDLQSNNLHVIIPINMDIRNRYDDKFILLLTRK